MTIRWQRNLRPPGKSLFFCSTPFHLFLFLCYFSFTSSPLAHVLSVPSSFSFCSICKYRGIQDKIHLRSSLTVSSSFLLVVSLCVCVLFLFPILDSEVAIIVYFTWRWSCSCDFLTQHHAMKAYWGVEVYIHEFLTSALDGGEWSGSRPGRFTPRERAPGTHWIGGWVGRRAVLDTVVRRKILSPYWDSNFHSSSP
jgi:hypothetical protein